MNVAIFNWRDLAHPKAGGAEVSTHRLAAGLAAKGHAVTWVTSASPGAPAEEHRNGYRVIRRGSELTCRFSAAAWLRANRAAVDVAIDEVNTLPFLSRLVASQKTILWMHQLAREVWLAEAPPLLGQIGYATERALLEIYRDTPIVTVSQSSAASMREFGMRGEIHVVENGLQPPVAMSSTTQRGRIGYVGRLAPSKRIDHVIRAFALVRAELPFAELTIVGNGSQKQRRALEALARDLGVGGSCRFTGHAPAAERDAIVQSLDVLAMASMREGWGLVVSEAARFGVPSVAYPVAGLVDSVQDGRTGIVVRDERPEALAEGLIKLISDRGLRDAMGLAAMEYLRGFDEDRFVDRFERVLLEHAGRVRIKAA